MIRSGQISNRRIMTKNKKAPTVTAEMCNYVRHNLNESNVLQLVRKVSANAANSNAYWKYVIELTDMLDEKFDKPHKNIHSVIEYQILPKLDKANLREAAKYLDTLTESMMDITRCKSIIEENKVVERIAANHDALSKRFDFDKIAKENVAHKTVVEGVTEMCDLIDTYDLTLQAKFNIALENISYAFANAGYTGSIVENVVDYFLLMNPSIPDSVYSTMQNLVSESMIISDEDKKSLSYFTEAKGKHFEAELDRLADQCQTEEAMKIIYAVKKIKNERDAAAYIKSAVKFSMSSEDAKHVVSAIFMIPLLGKVSKPFVTYQFKLATDKNNVLKKLETEDFYKKVKEILDDEDEEALMKEATLITEDDYSDYQVPDYSIMEATVILESDDYADSNDIKDIINDFKKDQKKTIGNFKYYLGKIYRKSPESIIDETPNILAVIRVVFILAPSAVPIIGPIVSLVAVFIDKLLSMKINDDQSKALLKKLNSEKDKVEKDIEKKPEKKKELEKYKKGIENCIRKVEAYRDAHISDSFGDEDDDVKVDKSKDDELDFDMDDIKLESTILVATTALNKIIDAKENNLTKSVCDVMTKKDCILDDECIKDLIYLASKCKRSVDMDNVLCTARGCKKKFGMVQSVKLEAAVMEIEEAETAPESTINDLVYEAYCIEQLEEVLSVINEKAKILDKIKLTMYNAKNKVKDLSTKEKAMWKNLDIATSGFMRSIEKAMTSDRREAIIKGSLIPSFSKCVKFGILVGGISIANPVLGIITAMGMIGVSKRLNYKERQLIYDEIDTELKVVEKQIEIANNDGDMKKYRFLLQYQKRLDREKQRIKYGLKVHGRNVPMYDARPKGDDY